jgi:hypothetical protein
MLVLKKMKKSLKHLLKLLLIHKGIYLEIQDLKLKIIFQDFKICDLSSPICPKLSPRFLFNIIVKDFSKTFLFSITAEDFSKISDLSTDSKVQRFSPRFSCSVS